MVETDPQDFPARVRNPWREDPCHADDHHANGDACHAISDDGGVVRLTLGSHEAHFLEYKAGKSQGVGQEDYDGEYRVDGHNFQQSGWRHLQLHQPWYSSASSLQ